MFLAVPSIIRDAASTSLAFRSGILIVAISLNCSQVIVATVSVFEFPDHFLILHAFFNKSLAGGVFVMNENERSA